MTDSKKEPGKKIAAFSPVNGAELPLPKTFQPGEEARELGRKGGLRSAQVRKERKTLRDSLLHLLTEDVKGKDGTMRPAQDAIVTALMKQAMSGNTRAFEIIRDTIGEKPVDNVNIISPDYSALNEAFSGLKGGQEADKG